MKNKNYPGSALLTVVFITAFMTIWCVTIWRGASLLYETALKRQEYEQNYRATESIISCGIALCKKEYKQFIQLSKNGQKDFFIELENMPVGNRMRTGRCEISVDGEILFLKATLKKDDEKSTEISCAMLPYQIKDDDEVYETFAVKHWNISSQ